MQTFKTGQDAVFWTADDGEWVPAYVAQDLYNALRWVHERAIQDANGDPVTQDFDEWFDAANAALSAADGEEV